MQVSIESSEGLERVIKVEVPADKIEQEVSKRIKDASGKVKLNGFRAGKVPLKVVKQRFGAGIRQEVVGDTINRSFYEAVTKESLQPAGQPSIDSVQMEEGKDLSFKATFEVYPEVKVSGLDDLEVTQYTTEIGDSDIDKMIETLRESQAKFTEVERAAVEKDQVTIDFLGKKNGEPFEGGEGKDHKLVLGSNTMIPGFEDGIVGMKPGDSKTISVTFPEDYQSEELKGADATFDIDVKKVEEKTLPELNDDFFKNFGVAEGGLENFKVEVSKNMEREKQKAIKAKTKEQVMDALLEKNAFDVPKALISSEIDGLRNQMIQQYGAAAKNIDAKSILPDEMFQEQAKKRVALGLLLSTLIKTEKLTADKDKVRALIEEQASTYETPEEVINYYYSNEQMLQNIEAAALEDQVVDFVIEKANTTTESVDYQTLMARPQGQQ